MDITRSTALLATADLRRVVTHLPRDVQSLIKGDRIFIAGGFIRSVVQGEKPNDIDLFGPDKDKLHELAMKLAISRRASIHETDNAFTVLTQGRTPVQFIHRWLYEDAARLIQEFDYTIARAVVWWNATFELWTSLCDQDFYADLAARRLVYCRPERTENAGGSLMRARKFIARGYYISAHDLGAVVHGLVSKIDFEATTRFGNLEKVIIGLLREVDPLTVVDGIDVADEHASVPIGQASGDDVVADAQEKR